LLRFEEITMLSAKALFDLGITNVRYLQGGFKTWFEPSYSIFNSRGELKLFSFEKKED